MTHRGLSCEHAQGGSLDSSAARVFPPGVWGLGSSGHMRPTDVSLQNIWAGAEAAGCGACGGTTAHRSSVVTGSLCRRGGSTGHLQGGFCMASWVHVVVQPLAQGGAILLAAVRVWNRGVDLSAPAQGVHTLKQRQAAEQPGQPDQRPWGRRPPHLSS